MSTLDTMFPVPTGGWWTSTTTMKGTSVGNKPITHDEATAALDNMDDYARMSVGVDPVGPRTVLEKYIEQQRGLQPPTLNEWGVQDAG